MFALPMDLDEHARRMSRRLEDTEAALLGVRVERARAEVAPRIGLLPGTMASLRKGRIKDVRGKLYQKLRSAFIQHLQAELTALLHEFQVIMATGVPLSSDEAVAVRSGIMQIRQALALEAVGTALEAVGTEGEMT